MGVKLVGARCEGMMCRFLVMSGFICFGRFPVVSGGVRAMFSCLLVKFRKFRHDIPPIFFIFTPKNAAISDLFRNEDEFERLVLVVPPHLKPIIQIAVLTGMRLEELLSLEWPQIDLSRHEIRVENPKNDRPRIVPVADGAVLRLAPPGFTRCPLPRALNPDSPVAARFRLSWDWYAFAGICGE